MVWQGHIDLIFLIPKRWSLTHVENELSDISGLVQERRNSSALAVFEIAWWTGARDQQKQRRSSKTPVNAGPKDQQLVLFFFLNSHCPNIVQNTFQSSKQFSDLNSHGSQV